MENIKIFHLRPFAAICDHFEAPHSQKGVKESEMAYSPFSCLYLGSWTLIPINFFSTFWLWGASKWSQMAANGLKWKILMSFTRFCTKKKISCAKTLHCNSWQYMAQFNPKWFFSRSLKGSPMTDVFLDWF